MPKLPMYVSIITFVAADIEHKLTVTSLVCMWGKRRLNLLAAEKKIRENLEYEAQRQPETAPKVGAIKSFIIDDLTDECTGRTYWTAELIEKWRRRQESKTLQRKTKYGCWGHPGRPFGRGQVSLYR